ncbi:hypothetical protein Q7C36_022694 [Tachysurus vachellii]|uniref:Uncharacterized protein n=1 Tax=Tachysurus vachellii TaxID=175792 RepID=A0AA88IVB6_TACVA|nr:hypothetical protein Q7C36_022694 [Tachysurus vachellii]
MEPIHLSRIWQPSRQPCRSPISATPGGAESTLQISESRTVDQLSKASRPVQGGPLEILNLKLAIFNLGLCCSHFNIIFIWKSATKTKQSPVLRMCGC